MTYADTILATSGLQGYWRLGEASGTTVVDSSGNGRNGANNGATVGATGLLTGDADTAYSFDGVNDSVTVASSAFDFQNGAPYSAEFWINLPSLPTNYPTPLGKKTTGGTTAQWFPYIRPDGILVFEEQFDGAYGIQESSTALVANVPTHVVLVKTLSQIDIYLQGVKSNDYPTAPGLSWTIPLDGPFSISGPGGVIAGTIDDVAVYNVALSAATIADHYTAGTTAPSSPPPPIGSTHQRLILPDGLQRPSLTGGVTDVVTRVYRSDKTGQLGDEITDQISGGSVVIDVDRAIRGTCTIQTKTPDVLPQWSWVAITKDVTRESQSTITTPPDLFRIRQPAFTIRDGWAPATVNGEDLTVLLHNYKSEDTYNIGEMFTGHVNLGLIFLNAGITQRIIPATDRKLTGGRSFTPDATGWAIAETICTAMGWHSPVARGGTLVALENHGLAQTEPVRTYTLGQDARMIGEIGVSRDDSSFANVVVATSENPIRPPLRQVVKNDNPQSINSTTHPNGPGIVVAKVANNNIESDLVLRLLALSDLLQRNIIETVNLEIMPDYALRIFDTIRLDGQGARSHMQPTGGNWEIRSIGYGLTPGDSPIRVRAQRSDVYA